MTFCELIVIIVVLLERLYPVTVVVLDSVPLSTGYALEMDDDQDIRKPKFKEEEKR